MLWKKQTGSEGTVEGFGGGEGFRSLEADGRGKEGFTHCLVLFEEDEKRASLFAFSFYVFRSLGLRRRTLFKHCFSFTVSKSPS